MRGAQNGADMLDMTQYTLNNKPQYPNPRLDMISRCKITPKSAQIPKEICLCVMYWVL